MRNADDADTEVADVDFPILRPFLRDKIASYQLEPCFLDFATSQHTSDTALRTSYT